MLDIIPKRKKVHLDPDSVKLRYVYILDVDNRGNKSRFYGLDKILYTGSTSNIVRRMSEHLNRSNSKFLSDYFSNARRNLVFVKYVHGTELDAVREEERIKKMSSVRKRELIKSDLNVLVSYVPLKVIVLKKYGEDGEVCLRL